MIQHLAILLTFQLVGEALSQAFSLTLPGPVIGMALLFATLLAIPSLAAKLTPTASVLLAHLSLLFVPAGVGVIGHLDTLGSSGPALLAAIVGSTVAALLAGLAAFRVAARITQ